MIPLAPGSLLGQVRPAKTDAATLVTASLRTEITKIFVCNNSGSGSTFRIFHDVGGSTFDQGNCLYYDTAINANTTTVIEMGSFFGGINLAPADQLGVRSGNADAITFSAYGVVAQAV